MLVAVILRVMVIRNSIVRMVVVLIDTANVVVMSDLRQSYCLLEAG